MPRGKSSETSARTAKSNQPYAKPAKDTKEYDGLESTDGPLYFYGHSKGEWAFLSQWYPLQFKAPLFSDPHQELEFRTCEQYMMWRKAILFDDHAIADQIMLAKTPKKQKALGRKVKGFDQETWERERESIVEDGNWNKFTNSKDAAKIARKLLETEDREIIEVVDRTRGHVSCITTNRARHPHSTGFGA